MKFSHYFVLPVRIIYDDYWRHDEGSQRWALVRSFENGEHLMEMQYEPFYSPKSAYMLVDILNVEENRWRQRKES